MTSFLKPTDPYQDDDQSPIKDSIGDGDGTRMDNALICALKVLREQLDENEEACLLLTNVIIHLKTKNQELNEAFKWIDWMMPLAENQMRTYHDTEYNQLKKWLKEKDSEVPG